MGFKEILIIVVCVIILLWMIAKRNKFVLLKNEIDNLLSNISTKKEERARSYEDAMDILGIAHANDYTSIKNLGVDEQAQALMVCAQKYPDLKDTPAYATALHRIQNINEDINADQKMFNKAIKEYNQAISVFPASLVALIFGFKKQTYFDSENAEKNRVADIRKIDVEKYRM